VIIMSIQHVQYTAIIPSSDLLKEVASTVSSKPAARNIILWPANIGKANWIGLVMSCVGTAFWNTLLKEI
jgi:hypothetical protein